MDEQERIEGQDEDVEAHRAEFEAAGEASADDDGDDVEGHILHRPTSL